jgi:hypothetical protein
MNITIFNGGQSHPPCEVSSLQTEVVSSRGIGGSVFLTFRVTSILPSSSICAWPSTADSSIATSTTASLAKLPPQELELEQDLESELELAS